MLLERGGSVGRRIRGIYSSEGLLIKERGCWVYVRSLVVVAEGLCRSQCGRKKSVHGGQSWVTRVAIYKTSEPLESGQAIKPNQVQAGKERRRRKCSVIGDTVENKRVKVEQPYACLEQTAMRLGQWGPSGDFADRAWKLASPWWHWRALAKDPE